MSQPPQRIADRYELTHAISTGGMGQVWRGYDILLDRPVAVKVIRPDLVAEPSGYGELAARFTREARVTALIEHPGVPAVHDAAVDRNKGLLYLVMQLVRGAPLSDLINEQAPLPVPAAVSVAAQVCTVLARAHAVPVIHRDLKPGNIMVDEDGTAKVLDFGVAAILRTDMTRLTVTGSQLGTFAYMPPEQVQGLGASPGSDLYSLGCVLYELLTGHKVFPGDYNNFRLQVAHVEDTPPPASTHRPDLPADLEALLTDLLAKNSEDRPASAQRVHDRLAAHLPKAEDTATPERPPPPGALPDPARPYRRPMAPRPQGVTGADHGLAPTKVGPPSAPPVVPGLEPGALDEANAHAAALLAEDRFAQSVAVLDEVVEPAAAALGHESAKVVELRLLRVNALALGGDYRRALPEFTALAGTLERQAGPSDERALLCLQQAAYCLAQLGQTTQALHSAENALGRVRAGMGERSELALELRRDIGMCRLWSGDVPRAARELTDLHDDLLAVNGPEHPDTRHVGDILDRLRNRGAR